MKLVGITFLLMVNIGFNLSEGLRCWVCENQPNEAKCIQFGGEKDCASNQGSCENQIRSINSNTQVLITKGCKQDRACSNNGGQNTLPGWTPTQCNEETQASACTCCCSKNLCNKHLNTRCGQPMCPDLGDIEDGTRVCTMGRRIDSDCKFTCNEGFELIPASSMTLRCRSDETWNGTKPCCLPQCKRYGFFDIVFALDSSSSVGSANWQLLQNFVSGIISNFMVGERAARFGVYRYNRGVDTSSQILLNTHPNSRTALLQAVQNIPYNGRGTHTGTAMEYARTTMFTPANGDRSEAPNVFIVITDGRSQQRSLVVTEAKAIRAAGVLTFAVRIGAASTQAEKDELKAIAGSSMNVLKVDNLNNAGELTKLATKVTTFICSSRTC